MALNALVNREGYYEINFAELEALAKKPETKLMLLCNPHNPVGRAWTKEELERVGRICLDNGVMIAQAGVLSYMYNGATALEDTVCSQRYRTDEMPIVWR